MTDEQKQRRLEANRAYRERQRLKKSQEKPIPCTPNPEAEEAWKRVQPGKIEPLSKEQLSKQVSNKEKAAAVVCEAVAREEMVSLLFAKYEKTTNIPQLLAGILRELIETRIVLVDLIGGLRK